MWRSPREERGSAPILGINPLPLSEVDLRTLRAPALCRLQRSRVADQGRPPHWEPGLAPVPPGPLPQPVWWAFRPPVTAAGWVLPHCPVSCRTALRRAALVGPPCSGHACCRRGQQLPHRLP